MSVTEIEHAITTLPPDQLEAFARWFEDYLADTWDEKISTDANAGRLNDAIAQAKSHFNTGRAKEL